MKLGFAAAAAAALTLATAFGGAASAEGKLSASRVGAADVAKVVAFYETVFGLKEVNKFNPAPNIEEHMLNFGADDAAAKANKAPELIVMSRAAGDKADGIMHFVIVVDDIDKTLAAVTANGGTIVRPKFGFPQAKMELAFVADPDGNQIEVQAFTK
jgi:predicted enzyme related to lactoylglutathione lyase